MTHDPLLDSPSRSPSPDLAASQQQQQHILAQDEHLDTLTASLERQHMLSLQMNDELDLHQELLEDLDRGAEHTGLRLGGASRKLDTLRQTIKDHGKPPTQPNPVSRDGRQADETEASVYALAIVIVVLILLIVYLK